MAAGRRASKPGLAAVFIVSIGLIWTLRLAAQVRYFQTYEDIVNNRPIPSAAIKQMPFWRVTFDEARPLEMWQIDSTGQVIERRSNAYDAEGNLQRTQIYAGTRLTKEIIYQPDSLQTLILRQVTQDPQYQNRCDLLTETIFDTLVRAAVVRIKDYPGSTIGLVEYGYGQRGELVVESFYAGERERLLGYTEFQFSAMDSVQTVRQYDGEGRLKSQVSLRLSRAQFPAERRQIR